MTELVSKTKSNYTEKQLKFLDALFGAANGNFVKARKMAGYSEKYHISEIIDGLAQEIIARCEQYLAANSPKAVINLVGIIDDPTQLGSRDKLNAIREVLDRVGLVKTEKVKHETDEGAFILILPPKQKIDED